MKKFLAIIILSLFFILPSKADNNYKNIVQVRWCKYPIGSLRIYQLYPDLIKANPYNALRRDNCETVYGLAKIERQYSLKEVLNLKYMRENLLYHKDNQWINKKYWPLCYNISSQSVYSIYTFKTDELKPKIIKYKKQSCESHGGFLLEFDGRDYFYIGKKEREVARAIDHLLDQETLDKLMKGAKDFKDGKISEAQFDNIKDEILKSL